MPKYLLLVLWIAVYIALSAGIGLMTQESIPGWYENLTPPPLTPPNIAFPIVWSILYALIASAGWYIWVHRKTVKDAGALLNIYAVYMIFNWAWSFIFFGAHMLLGGFLWIIALNLLSVWFMMRACKTAKPATLLMVLPTIWTLYAAYLNGGYWWLNS